jgi:RHS repeat-associated protein
VTDSRNRVTTMTYDVVNRMATKTLPNGVKTVYSYDDLDRIINLTYTNANGTVLVSETYTRNAGGEPSKVLREDGSYTLYEYDVALRLSKEAVYNPAGGLVESIEYSYDLDGKRTKKVDAAGTHNYNYNANGQLASVGQDGYVYDVDGRLQQFNRDSKTVVLSHDSIDHLTQVSVNGVNTQYLYDAQGNRIGEVSGGNTKNYLVAPNLGNGLESTDLVTDGNGNVVSDYVYGGSSIIARLDANGEPIYYLTDSMGSVIGLVDGNGDRVSRIIYDGFGEVKSGDDGTSLGGDFRFQGQWLETESGLYYMRARDYDATTGLFLSRDAVDVQEQSVEAFNPYQFAYNNPFVFSDPTGLFSITEINATLNVQNALTTLRTYSGQQIKQYFQQKVGEVLANAFTGVVKRLLPFGDINFDSLPLKFQRGTTFEEFIVGQVCGIFKAVGGPFVQNLWLEPSVRGNGKPTAPGLNCQFTNNRIKPLKGRGSQPDFIFKEGKPTDFKANDPSSFLIGDIKITYNKALSDITGIGGGNTAQWRAISAYASQYEITRTALYITFNRDSKDHRLTSSDEAIMLLRATKEAASAGVILTIAKLVD